MCVCVCVCVCLCVCRVYQAKLSPSMLSFHSLPPRPPSPYPYRESRVLPTSDLNTLIHQNFMYTVIVVCDTSFYLEISF